MSSEGKPRNKIKYVIESGIPLPPIKSGRRKSVTNDVALVRAAIEGIKSGKYKSFSDAARKLSSQSLTLTNESSWKKVGSEETIFHRLRRLIGRACNGA